MGERDTARSGGATVADVARLAKVSKATAARALGDYGSVNEGTRERVLAAAAAVGYLPNALARTMSTGRSHTIGVVLGDIENPFFAKATRGISDVARAAGFDLILCNTDEDIDNETNAIKVLLEKRVDGFIIAPAVRDRSDTLERISDQDRPAVLFDRGIDGAQCDIVTADNRKGGYELTAVLTRAGHRRIAFISTLAQAVYRRGDAVRSTSVSDRLDGFHDALDEKNIEEQDRLVFLDARRHGVGHVIERALNEGATAIVASDSLIAQQVMHTAMARGRDIPSELSLVSFDDANWTSLSAPPVTVMSQPIHEIGEEAARLLIGRLRGDQEPARTVFMDQHLIERDSVGRPPS